MYVMCLHALAQMLVYEGACVRSARRDDARQLARVVAVVVLDRIGAAGGAHAEDEARHLHGLELHVGRVDHALHNKKVTMV